ncbi:hypothetical protein FOA52_007502 [Chlamydomonas sp. UWO 241]|nr:hypothetical protein FOA52_007502 [Chlamydomonas sp. UWO 241]
MAEPAIVRLTGSGNDPKPNAELPIDVNYAKIVDFLVARQKLPKDWHKRLQAIAAKANEAVKEAPREALSKLPGGADGAPMDYWRSVALRDDLASTCEKTMFGGLTGPASTWDKIVKAYENQAVFLGEAAMALVQNADYEIPFLRKQAQRLDTQVTDCERKAGEYRRSATQCAAAFQAECGALGVDRANVRGGLRGLALELPSHLGKAPTEAAADGPAKDSFYEQLHDALTHTPAHHYILVMGDFNATTTAASSTTHPSAECGALGVDRANVRGGLRSLALELPSHLGKAECGALGVDRANVRGGLRGLALELPSHLGKAECGALGVDRANVRGGLRSLALELPSHLGKVVDAVQAPQLGDAVAYYRAFSSYAHGTPGDEPVLETLAEVREERTAPPSADGAGPMQEEPEAAAALEVNWDLDMDLGGGGDDAPAAPAGIDWDLDLGAGGTEGDAPAAPAGIDWDLDLSAVVVAPEGEGEGAASSAAAGPDGGETSCAGAAAVDIDWGIDMAGDADTVPALDIDWDVGAVEVEVGSSGGGADQPSSAAGARGRAAVLARLERDADYRSRLVDDLQELRSFLFQRKAELAHPGTELLSALLPEAVQKARLPSSVAHRVHRSKELIRRPHGLPNENSVDGHSAAALLEAVDAAAGATSAGRLRQLLMLCSSARYFERTAGALERKAGQEARMLAAAVEADKRKREAQAQLASIAPKVTVLVARTRSTKARSEAAMARLFAGRAVNVLGDINTVLATPGL